MLVRDAKIFPAPHQRVANKCLGFMTKIKKLLETVCHNCGKILVDEVSHPRWDGRTFLVHG